MICIFQNYYCLLAEDTLKHKTFFWYNIDASSVVIFILIRIFFTWRGHTMKDLVYSKNFL